MNGSSSLLVNLISTKHKRIRNFWTLNFRNSLKVLSAFTEYDCIIILSLNLRDLTLTSNVTRALESDGWSIENLSYMTRFCAYIRWKGVQRLEFSLDPCLYQDDGSSTRRLLMWYTRSLIEVKSVHPWTAVLHRTKVSIDAHDSVTCWTSLCSVNMWKERATVGESRLKPTQTKQNHPPYLPRTCRKLHPSKNAKEFGYLPGATYLSPSEVNVVLASLKVSRGILLLCFPTSDLRSVQLEGRGL